MAFKEYRNMKVYEQSGYHYQATPTIILKGQWLKECDFDIGTPITVKCERGKLTILKADEIIVEYGNFAENPLGNMVAEV